MVCLWERCLIRCASPAWEASNSMVRPRKGVPLQTDLLNRERSELAISLIRAVTTSLITTGRCRISSNESQDQRPLARASVVGSEVWKSSKPGTRNG